MRTRALLLAPIFLALELPAQDARPSSVQVHSDERGLPSATLEYRAEAIGRLGTAGSVEQETPVAFTALAIGWSADDSIGEQRTPLIRFRSRTASGSWTAWRTLRRESAASENPSGLSWSELALTMDGKPHAFFELEIPDEFLRSARFIRIICADASDGRLSQFPEERSPEYAPLDLKPPIVPRSAWWGDLPPAYLNPTNYTPEYVNISHAVVHHTAGVNNPPDPAQDVRGIWYYHVFGQGWADIAYNFLIDQYGAVYQGRYNPYVELLDVRGSHATYANDQSVGISLLGTFGADTPPTIPAVQSLTRLLAWRFDQKQLDPLSRALMVRDDAGNTVSQYRICGHRDISPTECPGEALYSQLPAIRQTAEILIAADDSAATVQTFFLAQNYPNPFNPATTIEYSLPESGPVRLVVSDLLGQELARLVDGWQSQGPHTAVFDGALQASGTYFCTLTQGARVYTRRMMLIR